MSSLTCTKLTLFTLAAVVVQIIGIVLFILGFFPIKPALSGVSGPESYRSPIIDSSEDENVTTLPSYQLKSLYQELSEVPPSFDRLVLMVVDGLPAEFVLGKNGKLPLKVFREAMPYTQSLLAKQIALGYHANAAPPTVTMPRLKAIVSGAIGGFLDVAFNFRTQVLSDDNLIVQFFRIGWKMVMLGDETWLKLFPGVFSRHDGVSSFFVKDTIEVDHNVSRHLDDELNKTDWNLMILHYLGLDHVGHVGGRNSILMGPKLKEMDEVIEKIHLSTIQADSFGNGNCQRHTLLLVVSDHGMTEGGNHGGSSYEETDSLALFVGPGNYDYRPATHDIINQVDIAPTLALLFGVPIPKNNVGQLIMETFNSLTDDQRLRALELNSWQLLRLLYVQLPHLSCGKFFNTAIVDDQGSGIRRCGGTVEELFCCLFSDAVSLHRSWRSKKLYRSCSRDDYHKTVSAYHNFLRMVSEWLSHRVTDKPVGLLASGVTALLLSCLVLLGLLLQFVKEMYVNRKYKWHLDETFMFVIVLILVLSMGSSSLVEEEQYIWHFMTSTLFFIFLRKTLQSAMPEQTSINVQNKRSYIQIFFIVVVLLSGRILRGWHQGGVNWTHLPDISKWLEQEGSAHVKSLQLVSGVLVISSSLYALSLRWSKKNLVIVVGFIFHFLGWFVLHSVIKYQDSMFAASSYDATLIAQIIYALIGAFTIGITIVLPWLLGVRNVKDCLRHEISLSTDVSTKFQMEFLLLGLRDSMYVIGWGYVSCWCLLQLLLQQPINSLPIALLLIQILATICYYGIGEPRLKQWVEVAALFCLGMTGHFGLGNTNTLATVDVAGAFIGITSHSTFLSGVLMFSITYASSILALLSMVMYISLKKTDHLENLQGPYFGYLLKINICLPCLLPLGLNSVILIAYTVVLLLMRNHLFIWSVFSPKYLYVCAATVCIYVGVFVVASTALYVFYVQRVLHDSRKK